MEKSDEIKRYYIDIERFDWVTDPKHLSKMYHRRRECETAKLIFKFFKGSTILDIGCGTGLITRHLEAELTVGLDINQWAIERAKVRSPSVDFITGDAENIPLKPNLFDAVICTEVLEHLPQPEKAVQEIFQVLKHGGLLIGSVPSANPVWKLRSCLSSRSLSVEPFHCAYRITELRLLLNDFQILDMAYRAYYLVLAFVAQKP